MHLARFPRRFIAHLPTPLERMDRLTKELGGPEIWIKRDDCTGLSTAATKPANFSPSVLICSMLFADAKPFMTLARMSGTMTI